MRPRDLTGAPDPERSGSAVLTADVDLALEHDSHVVGGVAFAEDGLTGFNEALDAVSRQPLVFELLHALQLLDALERGDDLADGSRISRGKTLGDSCDAGCVHRPLPV